MGAGVDKCREAVTARQKLGSANGTDMACRSGQRGGIDVDRLDGLADLSQPVGARYGPTHANSGPAQVLYGRTDGAGGLGLAVAGGRQGTQVVDQLRGLPDCQFGKFHAQNSAGFQSRIDVEASGDAFNGSPLALGHPATIATTAAGSATGPFGVTVPRAAGSTFDPAVGAGGRGWRLE